MTFILASGESRVEVILTQMLRFLRCGQICGQRGDSQSQFLMIIVWWCPGIQRQRDLRHGDKEPELIIWTGMVNLLSLLISEVMKLYVPLC